MLFLPFTFNTSWIQQSPRRADIMSMNISVRISMMLNSWN
jgi:hypothetical protein